MQTVPHLFDQVSWTIPAYWLCAEPFPLPCWHITKAPTPMLTQPFNVFPVIYWVLPQHTASTTLQFQCKAFVCQRSKQTFLARKKGWRIRDKVKNDTGVGWVNLRQHTLSSCMLPCYDHVTVHYNHHMGQSWFHRQDLKRCLLNMHQICHSTVKCDIWQHNKFKTPAINSPGSCSFVSKSDRFSTSSSFGEWITITVEPSTHNTHPIYSKYEKVLTSAKTNFNKHDNILPKHYPNHQKYDTIYKKILWSSSASDVFFAQKFASEKSHLSFNCTFSWINTISDTVYKSLLEL